MLTKYYKNDITLILNVFLCNLNFFVMIQLVFNKDAKFVNLVEVAPHTSMALTPKILEYDNPNIIGFTPCEKKGNKFYDLRTGEQVKKIDDMQEWPILTGAAFHYPDGKIFLVTRRFADQNLIFMEISSGQFNPVTMMKRNIKGKHRAST